MKKRRITYGVRGMMEYQALIPVGKATLRILFTDGSMNSLGAHPAKFTTDNFMVQHAIENSSDFRRGRIQILHVYELDEDVRIECNKTCDEVESDKSATVVEAQPTIADADEYARKRAEQQAATEGKAENPSVENPEVSAEQRAATENKAEKTMTELEFTCNDDAKDYLEKNFGAIRSKLRTRADIVSAGKENGVDIHFDS